MNLKDLLTNPDYVNANQETKKAIFEKFAPQDENFVSANEATQNAIREKWGVEVSMPKPQTKGTVTIGGVDVKKPTAVVGPAIGGALGELVKGAGAVGELVTPEKYQQYPKKVTEMGQSMVDLANQFNPVTATVGQIGSYALPQSLGTRAVQAVAGKPSNLINKMLQEFTVGGALGSAMTPGDAEDRAKAGGINAAFGAVAPVVGSALNQAWQKIGQPLVEPFTREGKEAILARALRKFTGGEENTAISNLQNAKELVPGSKPTTAQVANVPSLASVERAVGASSPEATNLLANRQAANAQARIDAAQNIATPSRIKKYTELRAKLGDDLYEPAIQKSMDFSTLTPELQQQIQGLITSPAIKKAMSQAKTNALNEGKDIGNPSGSLRGLHQTKIALDEQIASVKAKLERDGINAAKNAELNGLKSAKNRLLGFIEDPQISPEYKVARETFDRLSKPVNQLEEISKLVKKSIDPNQTKIFANNFARELDNIKQEGILSKQQIARLEAINDDIKTKTFADTAGKGVGSDTVQKLAYSSMVNQANIPNLLRNWPGGQIAGKVAQKIGDVAYKNSNKELESMLAQTMLSPEDALRLLQMPNVSKPLNTTATENLAKMLMLQKTTQGVPNE